MKEGPGRGTPTCVRWSSSGSTQKYDARWCGLGSRRHDFPSQRTFAGSSLALAGLGVLFSDQVLWLLGAQYAHLQRELAWFLGSLVLGTMANAAWGLCYTKNWVRLAWIQIPVAIIVQIIAACWLDLGRVSHAIVFSGLSNLTGLLIAGYLVVRGLRAARHGAIVANNL